MKMMNGVIMHHPRVGAFFILWLSLVGLSDPYPSSGGSLYSHDDGGLSNNSGTEVGNGHRSTSSGSHSRKLSTFREILSPGHGHGSTTLTQSTSTFAQLPTGSGISANNSTLSSGTSLYPLQSPSAKTSFPSNINSSPVKLGNTGSSMSNKGIDHLGVVLPVNKHDSANSKIKGDTIMPEKGDGDPTPSLELNSESLKESHQHHHPKLSLRLDRDYSPREIADYIWRTGDEKGFSQVVAEMVQDGELMMESKDDVILFLEMVQENLDKIRRIHHTQHLPS